MNRQQILNLKKLFTNYYNNPNIIAGILAKSCVVATKKMEKENIRLSLQKGYPVAVKNRLIIGYDPDNGFMDVDNNVVEIDNPVNAIEIQEQLPDERRDFAIINRIEWDAPIDTDLLSRLKVGEIYLPKHAAVFNFLNPSTQTKNDNIQSMLSGVNINIYERENYVDNCLHEIGHLFWRTCLTFDEKMQFKELYKYLRPSAIYEYKWEKKDEQEVFCTIYKWYLKSILINKSFYSILEYEEPAGLKLLQQVFDRIAKDRIIDDIWDLAKNEVMEYFNPKLDLTTGKFIRKKGMFDRIKGIELPESVLNDVDSVRDGVSYIRLNKALVPVNGNKIAFEVLEKAKDISKLVGKNIIDVNGNPIIYMDMDGVLADFIAGYKQVFGELIDYNADSFTVNQTCMTEPHFFRMLPVLERGRELYNKLKDKYQIVFLTTPMQGMPYCKSDKIAWIRENFGDDNTILFSDNKADFARSSYDFLIDDMPYNLKPFAEAGGTALDFRKMDNNEIIEMIENTINPVDEIREIIKQLRDMQVNTKPSEAQKESGIYKKGDVVIKGLKIKVENPKGSIRFGIGENGKKWISRMKNHYGYIQHDGDGIDGDKVDVFIGDNFKNNKVFIINQGRSGLFDEHKVLLGFPDINDARDAYLSNYQKGWEENILSIIPTNIKKFREWLNTGNLKEPFRAEI